VPIIEVLKELDGSGYPREITDTIIDKYNISDEELELKNKNGGSTVKNRIAWARFYLVKGGYLDSSKKGVWTLTDKGNTETITSENSYEMFRDIHKQFEKEAAVDNPQEIIDPASVDKEIISQIEQTTHKEELLALLKNLPPNGFERLCQRLLRESGFTQVKVTGKTGDGGIDGVGLLEINPLLSLKVLFQSKRYDKSVGPDKIRDFRGALAGRADKGIFITTGTFTNEAKNESVRDGAEPIELIDGEKLIELFEKLELGLKTKTIYEVDHSYFDEFLK